MDLYLPDYGLLIVRYVKWKYVSLILKTTGL